MDEVDVDEEGLAEMLMDDNSIAQVSRPGTSLKAPGTGKGAPSQGVRYCRLLTSLLGEINLATIINALLL